MMEEPHPTELWPVIRNILVTDWGFDDQVLEPTTPLFPNTIAAWMDWVDLIQTISEQVAIEWPNNVTPDSLTCGQDLLHLLESV